MRTLFGQVAFSVGDAEYRWEDVVAAAERWGDWARLQQQVREAAACLRRLEEDETLLGEDEVEAAAEEFRYGRDLIAAEDMEAWLARWELTVDDWMDFLRGSILRRKWSADLPELVAEHREPDRDLDALLAREAICSGELDRLAHRLGGRAAIHARLANGRAGTEPITPERLEDSFQAFCRSTLTTEAVRKQIRARQTEWTRLDCESLSFPDEAMAQEALLCVREDGTPLAEVAADAKRELRRERLDLEAVDPSLRGRLLAAQKGELLGPLGSGDAFVVYRVLDKSLPSDSDPAVVAMAERTILERLVDREIDERVRWRVPRRV
jgi:hypothetical protein